MPSTPSDTLHAAAVALLTAWAAPDDDQDAVRRQLLDHLAGHEDAMWRSCPDGHLTGSTLVVDATGTRALFTLHPKIGRWLQMGGHCEPGDADLAATARREAVEESGIDGLVLLPGPVDLDIHSLQCPKGHPNRHLDVRWLAVAPRTPPPGRATSRRTSAGSRSTPHRPTPTRARSGWCGWPGRGPSTGRPSPDASVRPTPHSLLLRKDRRAELRTPRATRRHTFVTFRTERTGGAIPRPAATALRDGASRSLRSPA